MLVLSRKIKETIVIGDEIRITILGAKGAAVRIGVEAPLEVRVRREELRREDLYEPDPAVAAGRTRLASGPLAEATRRAG